MMSEIWGRSEQHRFCYPLEKGMNTNLRIIDHIGRCYGELQTLHCKELNIEHVVEGVKGIPIFHDMLPYWSMVDTETLDVMHLFEGVHSLLIKLWTKKIYNGISPRISFKAWQIFDVSTSHAIRDIERTSFGAPSSSCS